MRLSAGPATVLIAASAVVLMMAATVRPRDSESAFVYPAPRQVVDFRRDEAGRTSENPRVDGPLESRGAPDPRGVTRLLDELDSRTAVEIETRLADVLSEHGVHAWPLIRRILTDPRLPKSLREKVVMTLQARSSGDMTGLLAGLAAGDDLVPDCAAMLLQALPSLLSRLHELDRASLAAPCLRARDRALISDDPAVRAAAVAAYRALQLWKDDVASTSRILLDRFESDPQIRWSIQNVFVMDEDLAAVPGTSARLRALLALARDPADRRSLLHMLAATPDPEARAAVVAGLSSEDVSVRQAAAFETGRLGAVEAVPALAALLVDPTTDAGTREAYVLPALAKIPSIEAASTLLKSSTPDDSHWRMKALNALLESPAVKDPRLGPTIAEMHRTADDPQLRDLTARLLWRNSSVEAYTALRQSYLESAGEERKEFGSYLLMSEQRAEFVRSAFADLVGMGLDAQAIPELFAADPQRALRDVARLYLVEKRLTDEGRRSAVEALVDLETPEATAVLRKIVAAETDPALKSVAEYELRRRDEC